MRETVSMVPSLGFMTLSKPPRTHGERVGEHCGVHFLRALERTGKTAKKL
jgi:hypothetical protein